MLKDNENNFGDLDKIEEYLIGLQPIKNEEKVETIELNDTQIVPDEVEEETPIVLDEIKEEVQVDEVTNDGLNDGIKRLV